MGYDPLSITIREGEVVSCLSCGLRIAEMRRDIRTSESLSWNAFKWFDQQYLTRKSLECVGCGEHFMRVGQFVELHLDERGWVNVYPEDFLC